MSSSTRSIGVAGVGADVDAERLVRRVLHLGDSGLQFVQGHRRRREDAEAAGIGRRRYQPRAGHPAHPGLDHRVLDADEFSQRRAQPAHDPDLLVPQCLGVDHLAQQLQLVARRQPRLLRVLQAVNLEGGVLCDLVRLDAGMQRQRPHGAVGTVEVEDAEVGHHPVHVDEPVGRVVGIDLVPTDPGHHVDGVAEHPLGVVSDPVAGGVVDGVARRASHAEHLAGRVLQGPERRQVLVAVPVDLVGAHHDVASAPGQRLENPAERHPALDRAGRADRGRVGQQSGLAVGEQDVGGERQPGQPGADRHHGRHRADHDLTGVAEQFGAGDGTNLCAITEITAPPWLLARPNLRTAAW